MAFLIKGHYNLNTIGHSGTVAGTVNHIFDGITEDSHSLNLNGNTHSHSGFTHAHTKRHIAKLNVILTSNTDKCNVTVAILNHTSGGTLAVKSINDIVGTSPFSIEVTYLWSDKGKPTYLEELSKLDQYSKAQYIPDRR